MGFIVLSQLRAELLFDLRNRTDTATADGLPTTRQNLWINAGYLHMCHPSVFRHHQLHFNPTITLVAGQSAYTFNPSSATYIYALRSVSHVEGATDNLTTTRTKLVPRTEQWFTARTHSAGSPRDYYIRGNQIVVAPVPDASSAGQILALSAWQEPALLSADGDTTVISSVFDEVLLLAARWRAELHLGYRDLAEATKVDFTGLLNEYRTFEENQGEDVDWMMEVRHESAMEASP